MIATLWESEDINVRTMLAKTLVAAVVLAALFAIPAAAQPAAPGQGRVARLTGSLSVSRANAGVRALTLNDAVGPGDELVTGAQSEAVIEGSDGSTVHLYPDSRVIFKEQSLGVSDFLHLIFGSIKVHIEKISGRPNPHSMTTPTAVIAVRGTTFSVFVDDADATMVAVDEGLVAVANRNAQSNEVLLRPGQRSWVRGTQPPVRAQRFRGRSEHADMAVGRMGKMGSEAMSGAMASGMGSAMGSGRMAGAMGASGRAGPPR